MIGYIYKISFKGTDKVYIGLTSSYKRRWRSHRTTLKRNTYEIVRLQHAYNKYGKENMKFHLIETCFNIDRTFLAEREKYYIKIYDSYKNGYNCTKGGEISEHDIRSTSKKVHKYCAKTGVYIETFDSIKYAAKEFNLNRNSIYRICNNETKTSKGFHYSFEMKTPEQVIQDCIYKHQFEDYRKSISLKHTGTKSPRYGGNKILLSNKEIVEMYDTGISQTNIGKIAGCSQYMIWDRIRKYKNGFYSENS